MFEYVVLQNMHAALDLLWITLESKQIMVLKIFSTLYLSLKNISLKNISLSSEFVKIIQFGDQFRSYHMSHMTIINREILLKTIYLATFRVSGSNPSFQTVAMNFCKRPFAFARRYEVFWV